VPPAWQQLPAVKLLLLSMALLLLLPLSDTLSCESLSAELGGVPLSARLARVSLKGPLACRLLRRSPRRQYCRMICSWGPSSKAAQKGTTQSTSS
jgi:hypothetical protein